MEIGNVLGFLLVAGVVVLVVWINHQIAARRREALRALAASLGLGFDPGTDAGFADRHAHGVFRQGHGRRALNVLSGPLDGLRVTMGDYRFVTGSGKNRRTHHFSFALLGLPFGPVPDLSIRAEHWGDKLLGAIGFDDIDFESEEFSRAFHVKSPDKRFAYDVVHPRMMEFLMTGERRQVEVRGGECLLYVSEKRWAPDEFRAHLDWGRRFLGLWPEHVRHDLAARAAQRGEA